MKNPIFLILMSIIWGAFPSFVLGKSADDCDQSVPPYIKGKIRQHHINNCLLLSRGLPPNHPTTYELPQPHEFQSMEKPDSKEWRFAAASENGDTEVYINARTIVKSGGFYRAWEIRNHLENKSLESGKSYRSVKSLMLHNCKDRSSATLSLSYYENQIGGGRVIDLHQFTDTKEFSFVSPGTIGEEVLNQVCRLARK